MRRRRNTLTGRHSRPGALPGPTPHLRFADDAAGDRPSRPRRRRSDRNANSAHCNAAPRTTLPAGALPVQPTPAPSHRPAPEISPTDARWLLAIRTASSLQGGRAAILSPERRERLVHLATRLGLRPFDANLVIAIVQDAARRASPLGGSASAITGGTGAEALAAMRDPDLLDRLALIPAPAAPGDKAEPRSAGIAMQLAASMLLGAGLFAIAAIWLLS